MKWIGLGQWGMGAFPGVLVGLLLLSLVIAYRARAHGFAQGQRRSEPAVVGH